MAKVSIKKESFTGRDGKPVDYERVIVTSETNPELNIELRLPVNELTLVKAIVASDPIKK